MKTKSAKKARKRRITLAGGIEKPQPAKQGRRTDLDLERAEEARRRPLEARLRVAGIPITPDSLKAAVAPDFGHDVGLCIQAILNGDEASKAREAFDHLSACHRNYMTLYIGQTGNPKCAAIAMIPEPMETDPSLRVDLRTHDEKVQAGAVTPEQCKRVSVPL